MRLKIYILFLISVFIMNAVYAQNDNQVIEQEVNEQVWKPFKQSYETQNAEVFNSLHTDDMLRINAGGITLGHDYKTKITERYQNKSPRKITIDFSHEHRYYRGDVGYEVGYYRVIYETSKDDIESYGRFHVVLKKIDGRWKIIQDWDTDTVGSTKIDKSFFDSGIFLNLI